MSQVLFIESKTPGILWINGFFCGPLEGEGQSYPIGRHVEIFVQLFPFERDVLPLTVVMRMKEGSLTQLTPQDAAFALLWPDGQIQLELTPKPAEAAQAQQAGEGASSMTLLRYLQAKLLGDAQAEGFLMRPQELDLTGYSAVVPLRFAPSGASERYDERAGLLMRLAPNVARVDAALAMTVPAGQGKRMIERVEIVRT